MFVWTFILHIHLQPSNIKTSAESAAPPLTCVFFTGQSSPAQCGGDVNVWQQCAEVANVASIYLRICEQKNYKKKEDLKKTGSRTTSNIHMRRSDMKIKEEIKRVKRVTRGADHDLTSEF